MALNPQGTRKEAVKAAVALAVGLLTLGFFIVILGGYNFWEDLDHYEIRFNTVKDLSSGRPVKFAGLTVGRVLSVSLDKETPGLVDVIIGVEKGFPLYEGTMASITQKGLVGDNFVLLELEGAPGPKLKAGAIIPYKEKASMTEVAQKVGRVVDDIRPRLERILDEFEAMLGTEGGKGISATIKRLPGVLDQTNATLASIQKEVEGVGGSLRHRLDTSGRHLDEALTTIRRSVSALQRDYSGLANTANTTVADVDSIVTDIDSRMDYYQFKIENILDNTEELTEELNRLVRSLEERPYRLIYTPERRPEE